MNRTQTIRLARAAYRAIEDAFPEVGYALESSLAGERRHRGYGRPGRGAEFRKYHPGAAPAETCAQLFVARWLAEYALRPERLPTLADTAALRADAARCAAIVARRTPEGVLGALRAAGVDPAEVAALDYVSAVS